MNFVRRVARPTLLAVFAWAAVSSTAAAGREPAQVETPRDGRREEAAARVLWVEPLRLEEPLTFRAGGEERRERDLWLILVRPSNLTAFASRGLTPAQLFFNDTPAILLGSPFVDGCLVVAAVRTPGEPLERAELWATPPGTLAGLLTRDELGKRRAQARARGRTLGLGAVRDPGRVFEGTVRALKSPGELLEYARAVAARQKEK